MSEEKTTGQMPFLSVRDLVVEYTMEGKVVHAVNGVSFDIQRGKTLALVGETGAGKTSIAKAILRVLPDPPAKITNGEIFVEGQDILKLKENEMRKYRGNKISMIFQDPMTALNPVKRVVDQIVEGIRQHEKKLSHAEAYNRACDMLNMVGISDDRAGEYPHQFSGGMKQRVVIALALALVSLAFVLLPGTTVSFTKPGKNKVLATVNVSGLETLTFHAPEELLHPTDSKGKAIYQEEAKDGELNAAAVEDLMQKLFKSFSISSWITMVLILAGIAAVLAKKDKKLPILLFLLAFVARLVTWLLSALAMPRSIGSSGATAFLYVSLPLLLFAAFFSNFVNEEELPKKYKLFLMMLPFLVAVFLFSYLPLYGWSYAFYNYKFGIPMDQQEFVGFKWFTEMFTNQGHRDNIIRVLKNTFGMSGLNLATSFLPMIFAIFLNEVNNMRFKKCVQIFTTLPNFISWALVFSFAMAMFAMDTGIFSKFMLAIGAIKEPVAWLNSSEHIWLKMWGWSTWKGLGWGAIMYLAAIAGIDQELYEAAKVDGANRWKQMRYITLPGLLPTFIVLFMLSISNILNNGMEQYMVFQNSMNKNTIEVLDLYVYNITIASKGTALYSFATAIGILKTLVSVTLLFSANFLSKKLRGESIV